MFATIKLIDEGNCAWESPTVYEILAQCKDLEYCNILLNPFCCSKHNGRLKCPEKYPVMCENKLCLNKKFQDIRKKKIPYLHVMMLIYFYRT